MYKTFNINKKKYIIYRGLLVFILLIIITIFSVLFSTDILFSILFLSVLFILPIIISFIVLYFKRWKFETLVFENNELIKLISYVSHVTGYGSNPNIILSYTSTEIYILDNIVKYEETLFSFVVYGNVEVTKTQENGTIKENKTNKMVIKKMFGEKNEVKKCLDSLLNK